jgi:hypothetical protein
VVALENFAADVDGKEWFVHVGDIAPGRTQARDRKQNPCGA